MCADSQEKLALSPGEADILFGIQLAEIQAKVALADHEIRYIVKRDALMKAALQAAESRRSAFDGVLASRSVSANTHSIDIDQGLILENESSYTTITTAPAPKDLEAERGEAVTCKIMGGDDADEDPEGRDQ